MKVFKTSLWIALVIFVSGCINNYQYSSRGTVTYQNGESHQAVLFWNKDEGRLWYGKKYQQLDSDVNMRVCQVGVKTFSLGDDGYVEVLSKNGDLLVAKVNADGAMEELPEAVRLKNGETCGVVKVEGKNATTEQLVDGAMPKVTFLCKNPTRPNRYPVVAEYEFESVEVTIIEDERTAPDPCLED